MSALTALPAAMRNKIRVAGDCWEWTGARNEKGYGSVADGAGGSMLAHRKAYALANGAIPAGLQIDHLCRNTSCVNPAHLEAITNAENARRRAAAQTHCSKNHPLSGENLRTRTTATGTARFCRACGRESSRAWSLNRLSAESILLERAS